jgi:hypothetical protein
MDITEKTGCSGSTLRMAAVTAAPRRSGSSSPVRTTMDISCEVTTWNELYSSSFGGSASPIWRTSPTTPTTVNHGRSFPAPSRTRRPIGSAPGQYFSAMVRFTRMLRLESESDSSGRPSPARSGIPIVSK